MSFRDRFQEDDMIRLKVLKVKMRKGTTFKTSHSSENVELLEDAYVHSSAKCKFLKTGEERIMTLYEHQPVYEKAKLEKIEDLTGLLWNGKNLITENKK
jgi:hypothetical protein